MNPLPRKMLLGRLQEIKEVSCSSKLLLRLVERKDTQKSTSNTTNSKTKNSLRKEEIPIYQAFPVVESTLEATQLLLMQVLLP